MRKLLLILALVSLALPSFCASTLPADPNLDQPVTLAIKGEALSDAMSMLEAKTGVRLRAQKTIADQKATIFVDDKPLRDVMNGIGTLFGYQWFARTIDGKQAYEIFEDQKSKSEREVNRQKAVADAWKRVDEQIAVELQEVTA